MSFQIEKQQLYLLLWFQGSHMSVIEGHLLCMYYQNKTRRKKIREHNNGHEEDNYDITMRM